MAEATGHRCPPCPIWCTAGPGRRAAARSLAAVRGRHGITCQSYRHSGQPRHSDGHQQAMGDPGPHRRFGRGHRSPATFSALDLGETWQFGKPCRDPLEDIEKNLAHSHRDLTFYAALLDDAAARRTRFFPRPRCPWGYLPASALRRSVRANPTPDLCWRNTDWHKTCGSCTAAGGRLGDQGAPKRQRQRTPRNDDYGEVTLAPLTP